MLVNKTIEKLNQLALVKEVCEGFIQEQDELIQQALLNCPDLNVSYNKICQELKTLTKKRSELIEAINKVVLKKEESIKGDGLQAIFSKGRTTWDTAKLNGYAIAHPEIEQLRKVGKPSVSIREVKEKKPK